MDLRTANVTRYILPLREGGSLPALAEADDEFKYVVKFRGAGHGTKALIAELIGGEIARTLGFRVPEIIFLNLDEAFGRTEAPRCDCGRHGHAPPRAGAGRARCRSGPRGPGRDLV